MDLQSLRQELDTLDKAEWTTWPHAYGSARDTPGHLAALLGDDEEAQRDAAFHFRSAIVHQSTLWPASPDAFAWLLRVLRVKRLPYDVLEQCLHALTEAADYLGDLPSDTPVPELSDESRAWLGRFAEASDDEHEELWEDTVDEEFDEEVYHWVAVRVATLRPTVLELATELADQAPGACAAVKEAWRRD